MKGSGKRPSTKADCDLIIVPPIDLGRIVKFNKPTVRVGYELQEIGSPT